MPPEACPAREELSAYALGTLPDVRADAVAEHVATCAACDLTVEGLERGGDTLIESLRKPLSANEFGRERECRRAVSAIEAIGCATATAAANLPPKTNEDLLTIRDYQLLAKLGEGGMGMVYKARHTKLGRLVAVKILPTNRTQSTQARVRFEREMAAVGCLEHPNIVRATDAGQHEGTHYLVMEYVEGLDLGKLVHRCGPLSVANACELIRQTAIGLQHVHEHGLVHRDIKPSNLMLTPSGQVRILDLGLALLHTETPAEIEITGAGQPMGTADYMAPEQANDSHGVDIRADIYSLGCTLYKLLTGMAPFSGPKHRNHLQILMGHTQDPVPRVENRRPDLPSELRRILDRMLAKDPEERFAVPAEVAAAIEPYADGSDLPTLLTLALDESEGSVAETPRQLATTANACSSPLSRTPSRPPAVPGSVAQPLPRRRDRRAIAVAVGVGAIGLLVALTVIITIRRAGRETTVEAPEGSRATIDRDGNVAIDLPEAIEPSTAPKRSVGGRSIAPPAAAHWGNPRFDEGCTSFYPYASSKPARNLFLPYPHGSLKTTSSVDSVRTGDLTRSAGLEIITTERDTVAVYDCWTRELWRRRPAEDSGVVIPAGRVPCCSSTVVADFDGDGKHKIAVLCGSRTARGWNPKAPMSIVVYDGDGTVVRTFSVTEGTVGRMETVFDFDRDGRLDLPFNSVTYRHPHSIFVYDFQSGSQLWRADFADEPVLGGVGDVTGDGRREIYVLQDFDCHVDPPVDDYDSDHCYAVLFDAQGKRLWKQEYRHCLNGCLADLNGDGIDEIVLIHEMPNEGLLYILDPKDGRPTATLRGLNAGIARAWSVADVTGDKREEIVLGDGKSLHVIDSNAERVTSAPAPGALVAAMNDLNGDGQVEIVVRQDSDLVLYDGQLKELARHHAPGRIHEAIVSDLDADGGNEIIFRAGEGESMRGYIVQLAPSDPSANRTLRTYPGDVAEGFLAAVRRNEFARAADYVMPDERDAVLAQWKTEPRAKIPHSPKLSVRVHLDEAAVTCADTPGLQLRLKFQDGQWWITSTTK